MRRSRKRGNLDRFESIWLRESPSAKCLQCCSSQPAPIASNPGSFNPVGSAQLGDGFGEIVAYGTLCQSQRTRQFSGSLTVASAAQDQTFSIGERVFFRAPYLRG